MIQQLLYYALVALLGLLWMVTTVACAVAVQQESKLWRDPLPLLSWWGCIKVFLFNLFWMLLCLLGAICVLIKHVLTLGRSDVALDAHCGVERTVALWILYMFVGRIKVRGKENLPLAIVEMKPAPVFVANHASQLDAAAVYSLERRFRWTAKRSVLYLPGVGQIMYLAGHVLIDRSRNNNNHHHRNKGRQDIFDAANQAVQSGIPMFFFAQGTRCMTKRLPFKDGAFIVAQTNLSTLIPISIEIPQNVWNSRYPFFLRQDAQAPTVVITIHAPIAVNGKEDRQELKQQCADQIYSVLPNNGVVQSKEPQQQQNNNVGDRKKQ